MRLLRVFARTYPVRSALMLGCLLLAGLAEGASLSGLLPLLAMAASGTATSGNGGTAPLAAAVVGGLRAVGLSPTAEVLLALIIGGTVLKAALVLAANQQVGYSVARFATDLRLTLIRALLGTRWQYYVHAPLGAFANAVAAEATRAGDAYLQATSVLMLAIQVVVYAVLACLISWQATLVALLAGGLMAILLHRLVRLSRRAGVRQTRLSKSLVGQLTDLLQAVKPLKAMGREHLLGPLLESETQRLNRALELEVLSRSMMRALQDPLTIIALAAGVYGAFTVLALPLSTTIMLVLLSTRLLDCLGRIQRDFQDFVVHASAYDSISEMTRQALAAREEPHAGPAPTLQRGIRLANVRFAYDGHAVLRDASLSAPAGELTVVSGASGAGKTTVADLVVGLIDPQGGAVLVDERPLASLDAARWRAMLGYVPQETLLLHDSIAANVTLGDPALSAADVDAALGLVGAAAFVAALPEGAATIVGERGLRLSGGQRQRIAVARALVHQPALLILDEATTALDPETEASLCNTFRRLRGRVTILAICHHGRLIELADHLYRIDEGVIVPVLRPRGAAAGGSV